MHDEYIVLIVRLVHKERTLIIDAYILTNLDENLIQQCLIEKIRSHCFSQHELYLNFVHIKC